MPVHRLRPRFQLQVPLSAAEVIDRLRKRLNEPGCVCRGLVAEEQGHVDLRVRVEEQHMWSPSLAMEITDDGGGGAIIRALIGPNPAVWTMVAFSYLALTTAALFLFTFGGVQLLLEQQPWALWAGGLALVLVVVVRIGAVFGRRLAAPQTAVLRHFLEDCFELGSGERQQTDQDPYHE